MFNNFFHFKRSVIIGNKFFYFYSYLCLFFAVLSTFLIYRLDLMLLSVCLNLLLGYIYRLKSICKLPGMIIIAFNSILEIQIPFLYIFSKDKNYNFQNFISTPKDNSFYYESIFSGSLFFIICYLLLLSGILIGSFSRNKKKTEIIDNFNKPKTIYIWVLIGLLTFFFTSIDNGENVNARSNDLSKNVSILAFFFNDKTYQAIFPVLFYLIPFNSKKKYLKYFVMGLILFFILNMDGASTASLLLIFTAFFLTPLAIFYSTEMEIIWPKAYILFIGVVISVPLFIFTSMARELSITGVTFSKELFIDLYSNIGNFDFKIMTDTILQRLSAVINNFMLLHAHYSQNIDPSYRFHFASYSTKSFMNLILPGTPFPESYVPTSQLFPKVLDQSILESNLDNTTLRQQLNTQPYSYFGFLLVIFGKLLTLLFSFFSGFIFSKVYLYFNKIYFKAICIFAFYILFHSYAFEASIQFILITSFTGLILVYLMSIFDNSKLVIKSGKVFHNT